MGYNTRPELVVQYQEYMEEIKAAVMQQKTVRFYFPSEEFNISTEQYRLRRALKASELHRNVLGGEYAGLGALVTLRIDAENQCIEVVPKAPPAVATAMRVDEFDAIEKLRTTKAQEMELLEFYPSEKFNEQDFRNSIDEEGWTAHRFLSEEDGKIAVTVEKKTRGVSKEAMARLGFGKGRTM